MPVSPLKKSINLAKYQLKIRKAVLSGPPYRSNLDRIILELTHFCDLDCPHCNRSCGKSQSPSDQVLTPGQIHRFFSESVEKGKIWKRISIEGGEPTLHPDIHEIIRMLVRYRKDHSPQCELVLVTNGFGIRALEIIDRYTGVLRIRNSGKNPLNQNGHIPFYTAPADLAEFSSSDFTIGCYLHKMYGMGFTPSGFYPHPICGGIDRIFGLDVGIRSLPENPEEFIPQMEKLCRLCGHFIEYARFKGSISLIRGIPLRKLVHRTPTDSWREALENFRISKPRLPDY